MAPGLRKRRNTKQAALAFTLLAVSACLLCSGPGWTGDRPAIKSYEIESKVYELASQSDKASNAASYREALNLLRQAASFDPTSYSSYLHVRMSDCHRSLHQYEQAEQEGLKALKFEPDSCQAYYSLALASYESEHYESAARYLRKLLQVSKDGHWVTSGKQLLDEIETYGNLKEAMKAIKSGNLEKSRRLLAVAARHDPSRVSDCVHANLAYVLRESGQPEQAIEEGKKSLRYKPDNKEVIYSLSVACEDIGRFDEAISWLQRYLSLESDPERRKHAQDNLDALQLDREKFNEAGNKLPDYLDYMVEKNPLHRWTQKRLPVKVYVAEGKGVKGFRPSFRSLIPRAMDTWCNASGNKLCWKAVADAGNADIAVSWTDSPIIRHERGHKEVCQGIARLSFADEDTIKQVRVEIDTMGGFERTRPLAENDCLAVCMHEIGHAFGLDHSSNYNDLMYFGASSKKSGFPTKRDRATMARLYQAYPVSRLAPPETTPAPVKYPPPPAFMPPEPPGDEDLKPPVFLPPPLVAESEKLTPPFFMPAPAQALPDSSSSPAKNYPPPPLFRPPPLKSSTAADKRVRSPAKKTGEKTPFFMPPPAK